MKVIAKLKKTNKIVSVSIVLVSMLIQASAVYGFSLVDEMLPANVLIDCVDQGRDADAAEGSSISYIAFTLEDWYAVSINLPDQYLPFLSRVVSKKGQDYLDTENHTVYISVYEGGMFVRSQRDIDVTKLISTAFSRPRTEIVDNEVRFTPRRSLTETAFFMDYEAVTGSTRTGENDDFILATLKRLSTLEHASVALDIFNNKHISVALNEKQAASIVDRKGISLGDSAQGVLGAKNTSVAVELDSDSMPDIVDALINLEGVDEANVIQSKDGIMTLSSSVMQR